MSKFGVLLLVDRFSVEHPLHHIWSQASAFLPIGKGLRFIDQFLHHIKEHKVLLYDKTDQLKSLNLNKWGDKDLSIVFENREKFDFNKEVMSHSLLKSKKILILSTDVHYQISDQILNELFQRRYAPGAMLAFEGSVIGLLLEKGAFTKVIRAFRKVEAPQLNFKTLLDQANQYFPKLMQLDAPFKSLPINSLEGFYEHHMNLIKEENEPAFGYVLPHSSEGQATKIQKEGDVIYSQLGYGCDIRGKVLNSMLSDDVFVAKGAVIENSVILDNVKIGARCKIKQALIGNQKAGAFTEEIPSGSVLGEAVASKVKKNVKEEQPNLNLTIVGSEVKIREKCVVGKNAFIPSRSDMNKRHVASGEHFFNE